MATSEKNIHLRFLHCSDIHLDTTFPDLNAAKSDERRHELRSSFMNMMQYVRDRGIDYVLMSGDIFDTGYATNATAEVLIREFNNCKDTKFIIAPGRSDKYENNPIYTSGRLPENCYVFTNAELDRFDFDDHNLTIYGWAYVNDEKHGSPIGGKKVDDSSKINIVCGYCDLDGDIDSDKIPMPVSELKKFGADYYALGSRHEASDFTKLGDSIYSYCGSLESTGFKESGLGGTNLIVIDFTDGELSVDVKRVTFGKLRFKTETIDITGVNTASEIINKISRLISNKKYGIETALCVELIGNIDPHFLISKNLESDAFGLYHFDMRDKTLPLFGTEKYKRDMSVKGELFRTLSPMLYSKDEDERLTAARAFRVGLAALEGRDIDL